MLPPERRPGWRVPVSEDRRPHEDGPEELYATFAALGGPLTRDEFMRVPWDKIMQFLGSSEAHSALVRQAALLLGDDTVATEAVVRDSLVALQDAWSRLGDLTKAHLYLHQAVVNRSRSMRRRRVEDHNAPEPVPDTPGAGDDLDRGNGVFALRALPDRQLEAIVLRNYMGLSEQHAAWAMGISIGAVKAHLARGVASLARPLQPD
jgi:DNA-directed RNA polymerase specialized sigma24 family protein